MPQVGLHTVDTSTTLESTKSHSHIEMGKTMHKKGRRQNLPRHPAQEALEWGKSPFAMIPLAAYLYVFLVRLIKRVRRTKRSHKHRK